MNLHAGGAQAEIHGRRLREGRLRLDVASVQTKVSQSTLADGVGFVDGSVNGTGRQILTQLGAYFSIHVKEAEGRLTVGGAPCDDGVRLNAESTVGKPKGDLHDGSRGYRFGRQHVHAVIAEVKQDTFLRVALIEANGHRRLDSYSRRLLPFALQQRGGSAKGVLGLGVSDGPVQNEMRPRSEDRAHLRCVIEQGNRDRRVAISSVQAAASFKHARGCVRILEVNDDLIEARFC